MADSATSRAGARGRPPRVTAERLRGAILEIRGEIPSMAGLARDLGVSVATLYSHVRGQEELRRLAADVVFDAWALPPAPAGSHWAGWLLASIVLICRPLDSQRPPHSTLRPVPGVRRLHL